MKNTGIIRKIDELGRIVIPKETRNILKISSGDDLEIYVENGGIFLKKYSSMQNLKENSNNLIYSLNGLVDSYVFISDKENIVTKGILENLELPDKFRKKLKERKEYLSLTKEEVSFGSKKLDGYFYLEPIIQNSDANGLVILYKLEKLTEQDKFFAKILKNIIAKQ